MRPVPQRLAVKFGLKRAPGLQPSDILPIFQRWIQQRSVPGMLIDVIDYKHVPEGPGIVLIADEADYAWDLGDGAVGMRYIRKRALPETLAEALRLCFLHAQIAAQTLESEAPDAIAFDFGAAEITFFDRLYYPNERQVAQATLHEATATLREVFGQAVRVDWLHKDPRFLLTLRCQADESLLLELPESGLLAATPSPQ